jgi:hypothetical protein
MARMRDPGRAAEAIAADLGRENIRVSVRSVERTLHEFGLTRGQADGKNEPAGGPHAR